MLIVFTVIIIADILLYGNPMHLHVNLLRFSIYFMWLYCLVSFFVSIFYEKKKRKEVLEQRKSNVLKLFKAFEHCSDDMLDILKQFYKQNKIKINIDDKYRDTIRAMNLTGIKIITIRYIEGFKGTEAITTQEALEVIKRYFEK